MRIASIAAGGTRNRSGNTVWRGTVASTTMRVLWNHSLGEPVTAVVRHGLRIESLVEHDWTVWRRFGWLVARPEGTWTLPPELPRLPLSVSLLASGAQTYPVAISLSTVPPNVRPGMSVRLTLPNT